MFGLGKIKRRAYKLARLLNDLDSISSPGKFTRRQLNKRTARIVGNKISRKGPRRQKGS